MYKYKIFFILFFYVSKAISSPLIFGVGAGYEEIHGLISDQVNNVLTRISLAKEVSMWNITESSRVYVGFEVAARNGFSGALDISDAIQDEISGPTPIAMASPELEFLVAARATTGNRSVPYILAKFGANFSVLKFDRADLMSSDISNLLGFIGLGYTLSETSDIHLLATGSRPLTKLYFDGRLYSIDNPYTQKALLVEFVKAF